MAAQAICKIDGCGNGGKLRRGLCGAHYRRLVRHGDPNVKRRAANNELSDWIEANAGHQGDDCLIWPFPLDRHGRGNLKIGGRRRGASRHMCELVNGPPPTPRHEAAHSCGRGHHGCMNPRHLRWATSAENSADKALHGTQPRGEDINHAKLTEADVRAIRRAAASEGQRAIARRYGVHHSTIKAIVDRETWAWVD